VNRSTAANIAQQARRSSAGLRRLSKEIKKQTECAHAGQLRHLPEYGLWLCEECNLHLAEWEVPT
jgi:hypothetical protein